MTIYKGYIGSLDDPKFKWEGGDWNGNIPSRIGPNLPPLPKGSENIFFKIINFIESGQFPGKQTEWGAYVAVVTKSQLQGILSEWYGPGGSFFKNSTLEHYWPDYVECEKLVEQLEDQTPYALVGTEF